MTPAIKLKEVLLLDHDLVTWCEQAVVETFSTMLGITPTLESVLHNPPDRMSHEISGVIGFIHNRMEGTLALGFNYETSIKLMSDFYNEELKLSDPNLVGGISELTNIIFGLIKEHYSNAGLTFKMCLPVVIVGSNHTVFSALSSNRMLLNFKTDHGPFCLEVMSVNSAKKGS